MRTYGKRFLRQKVTGNVEGHVETRDAILWDTPPTQRLCRIKIQGSNTLITAHYPENWEQTPLWLKPGNAVRVTHVGGIRGRIEIVGHGQVVPTPVAGTAAPTPTVGPNVILTGCLPLQMPTPDMSIQVTAGTYRIAGIIYTLSGAWLMGSGELMGSGIIMGSIGEVIAIDAAPGTPGTARYDLITVGADQVLDYTAGTPSTAPVMPTTPASHIKIAHILVTYGTTAITQAMINATYTVPAATRLVISIDDADLAWAELTTHVNVQVLDQYGNGIISTTPGYYVTLSFLSGNGTLSSTEDGNSTTAVSQHLGGSDNYDFTYTRDQIDPGDLSPMLQAYLNDVYPRITVGNIVLRDVAGDPMM